jgi:hypothetical protein
VISGDDMQAARDRAILSEEWFLIVEFYWEDKRVSVGPGTEDEMRARIQEWEGLFTRLRLVRVTEDYEGKDVPYS